MNRTQPLILTLIIAFCCLFLLQLAVEGKSHSPTSLLANPTFPYSNGLIADTICAGTCKIIGDTEYCQSGTYTVTDNDGTTYQLNLVVQEIVVQYTSLNICQGDTYLGEVKNQLGKQIISYNTEDASGCDMTVVVTLDVRSPVFNPIQKTIRYGECEDFGPNTLCQSGEYELRYSTIYGCDSIVKIVLSVEELLTDTIRQTVCAGQTFAIQDQVLDQSGFYQIWGENAQGRTTLTIVDFRVEPEIITTLKESSCEGQPLFINGASLSESGEYEYLYRAASGCDSLVRLELSVGQITDTTIVQTIPKGESFVVGRNNVAFEGNYQFIYQSIAGCDSIVNLELSFANNGNTTGGTTSEGGSTTGTTGGGTTGNNEEQPDEEEETSNETGNGGGNTAGSTGNGGDNESTGNGGSSVEPCLDPVIQESFCFEERPYKLRDNTFWEGGTFRLTYDAPDGCTTEEVTLQLTVETDRTQMLQQTICEGETFEAGGILFSEPIDTILELQAISGCDSTLVLDLNVATPKETTIEKNICFGDLFTISGRFVSTPGIYEELYQTVHGCDSLVIIDLSIDGYEPQIEVLELCAGECFADDIGNKACVSGTYSFRFLSDTGCDSIVTMELLIPDTVRAEVWDTFCKGSTYQVGIFSVTQPGRYREKYFTDRGCDSITHLNLFHVDCEINSLQDADTVICGGNTGQFSFMLTKGQGPFMYKWSSEDNRYSGQGNLDLNVEVLEQNLPGGFYSITVTDRFEEEAILELEIIRPELISANLLMPEYRGVNLACANDQDAFLDVIATGGVPPYSYEWSTGALRRRIDNLPSGDYSVTITDHYNCTHVVQQSLKEPAQLVMLATANDPICEDATSGSIAIDELNGGTAPYQFRIENGEYGDSGEFDNLGAGNYQLYVRDANNCLTDSMLSIADPVIIEADYEPEVTIELGDQVPLEIYPSHPVAMVEWEGPDGLSCYDCLDPIVQPLESSSYAVTITSEDDCITTATLHVKVAKERDVYVPNVFSPNTDGNNDRFTIFAGPEVRSVNYFRVYSRWGELLFEKNNFDPNDPQLGWDGSFEGQRMENGVYVWIAQLTFIDEVVEEYAGDVLLSK